MTDDKIVADAWLCEGPHGKSAHTVLLKLLPEEGCTLTALYSEHNPALQALIDAAQMAHDNGNFPQGGGTLKALRAALRPFVGKEDK